MASRNLGTLTIDLVAKIGGFTQGMSKAEREADKSSRNIKRKLNQSAKEVGDAWAGISKVLAASFAGISVASVTSKMIGIAKETANAAAEVKNLSALSNASTQDFQRMAHGAETVGISAEKLADIFKDVQDKAGDFAQTGGGGMADFFENIAPKVGVTVDQFRRLSGPEALQLYVSSLEKANLSQQDMTFYMEAIASDSTALLPLLQDNGRAWRELGDEAQRYGVILSDEAIAAAEAYREETRKLDASMAGLRVEISEELLPVLTDMNRSLTDPGVQGGINRTIELLAQMAAGVVDLGNEFFLGMQHANGFWDALFKYGTANPFKSPAEQLQDLRKELKQAQEDAGKFGILKTDKQRQNDLERIRSLEQQIGYWEAMQARQNARATASLEAMGRQGLEGYPSTPTPLSPVKAPKAPKGPSGKSQAERDMEAADRFLQSLRDQVFKTQERTAWEQLSYDIQAKGLKLSDDQLAQAQGLATAIDMAREADRARSAEIDRQNTLYSLQERVLSAQQRHQLEMMTYGMGDQAAAELRERMALMQQQQAELRQMQHEHGQELRNTESEEQRAHLQAMFEERYQQTQEAFSRELGLYDDAIKQKQAKEKDWLSGVQSGFATYARDAGNAYEQSKQLAHRAFGSMADGLTEFVVKGKTDFSSLATSIISDIIRMQMQAAISGLFSNVLGGVFGGISGGMSADRAAVYASGGYTGPGGKYEPAGIVHRGEVVWSQEDVARAGGVGVVEAMRKGLKGFANGGPVGPVGPAVTASAGGGINISIINKGGQPLQAESASMRRGTDGSLLIEAVVKQVVSTVAGQLASDTGQIGQAMRARKNMGM